MRNLLLQVERGCLEGSSRLDCLPAPLLLSHSDLPPVGQQTRSPKSPRHHSPTLPAPSPHHQQQSRNLRIPSAVSKQLRDPHHYSHPAVHLQSSLLHQLRQGSPEKWHHSPSQHNRYHHVAQVPSGL